MSTEKNGHGGARKGAGRPRIKEGRKQISLRLTLSEIYLIDLYSEELKVSRLDFVRLAIAHYIQKLKLDTLYQGKPVNLG